MRKTVELIVAFFWVLQFVNGIEASTLNILELDIRLCPLDGVATFLYRAKNASSETVEVDLFNQRGNCLGLVFLNDPERKIRWSSLNVLPVSGKRPQMVKIPSGQIQEWKRENGITWVVRRKGYELFTWRVRVGEPPPKSVFSHSGYVCLGFPDSDGNIATPVVDSKNKRIEIFIACIYHEKKPYELGFLFLNGTDADIVIEKPLTQASRIVASVPTIKYTRELVLPDAKIEKIAVEAGKVGEWRIPWQTLFELIPEEDVEKIKAAGGDLDLVWKVGEYESAPLPLSLSEPENNDEGDEDDDDDAPDGE